MHFMKRRKVKGRGFGEGRFSSVELYRRYELTKLPTAAGWRKPAPYSTRDFSIWYDAGANINPTKMPRVVVQKGKD